MLHSAWDVALTTDRLVIQRSNFGFYIYTCALYTKSVQIRYHKTDACTGMMCGQADMAFKEHKMHGTPTQQRAERQLWGQHQSSDASIGHSPRQLHLLKRLGSQQIICAQAVCLEGRSFKHARPPDTMSSPFFPVWHFPTAVNHSLGLKPS